MEHARTILKIFLFYYSFAAIFLRALLSNVKPYFISPSINPEMLIVQVTLKKVSYSLVYLSIKLIRKTPIATSQATL